MQFATVIVPVLLALSITVVIAFSAQRTDGETVSGSDSNSTKDWTCDAPIISNIHGRCPEPEEGIYCFACIDQCKSDVDCSPGFKCCPTFGCGNNCTDSFCKFH